MLRVSENWAPVLVVQYSVMVEGLQFTIDVV